MKRRKLPEIEFPNEQELAESEAFVTAMEEELAQNSALSPTACRRIAQRVQSKPRRRTLGRREAARYIAGLAAMVVLLLIPLSFLPRMLRRDAPLAGEKFEIN